MSPTIEAIMKLVASVNEEVWRMGRRGDHNPIHVTAGNHELNERIKTVMAALEQLEHDRLRRVPTAWMRGVKSGGSSHEPPQWDVEFSYGDDEPEGNGWLPLYGRTRPILGEKRLPIPRLGKDERQCEVYIFSRSDWQQTVEELQRLESLVYVPGLWRCPKCQFQLISTDIDASTGAMRANNIQPSHCPNCPNVWLQRVTEREAGNRLVEHIDAGIVQTARDALLAIEAASAPGGIHPDRLIHAAAREGLGRTPPEVSMDGFNLQPATLHCTKCDCGLKYIRKHGCPNSPRCEREKYHVKEAT